MEKQLTIEDILAQSGGTLLTKDVDLSKKCESFAKDSRYVNVNDTYFGIKGDNFNGSQFYEEALEKGAIACVIQDICPDDKILKKYSDRAVIKVDDVIKAMGNIAKYKRSMYSIPVVAVTGSVGKTSTKDIIANVLDQKYKVLKTQANHNNQVGLPMTILGLKDHTALVVEMGMSNLGEISTLSKIAKPTVAVITNIGTAHIGNLGSRQNILKAKLEILDGLEKDGLLVINNDNDLLNKWYEENKQNLNIRTYGINTKSDFMAQNIKAYEDKSTYEIEYEEKIRKVVVPIGGEHFVLNSLCAISIANYFDIDIEKILNGIKNFELTKSRMQLEKNKRGIVVINDAYNANYDSMAAALKYLGEIKDKRKIAVLGDMLELGEYSEDLHRSVGKEVSKNNIDILVTVGENAKYIASEASKIMDKSNIYSFLDNKSAQEFLDTILKKDDVVLIKASNGMKFLEIFNYLMRED